MIRRKSEKFRTSAPKEIDRLFMQTNNLLARTRIETQPAGEEATCRMDARWRGNARRYFNHG